MGDDDSQEHVTVCGLDVPQLAKAQSLAFLVFYCAKEECSHSNECRYHWLTCGLSFFA